EDRTWLPIFLQEVVISVKNVVPEKFPKISMKTIGPTFAHKVHIRAGASAICCIIHSGLYLEFLDGVRCGNGDAGLRCKTRRRIFWEFVWFVTMELKFFRGVFAPFTETFCVFLPNAPASGTATITPGERARICEKFRLASGRARMFLPSVVR